ATPGSLFQGTMSHFWYAHRTTMPDWSAVWEAGNPETTPERFERFCRVLGVTGSVVGSSSTIINAQAARGRAPIEAMRDVAGVEAGLVYADRDSGDIVFECRDHRYNPTSAVTITGLRENDLKWSDDDQHMVNDVRNRRANGSEQ